MAIDDGGSPMKVLVTNDDGVESVGLHALVRALVGSGCDVVVAAPDRDMSGSGAAIGQIHMDEHIDAKPVDLPGLEGVPAYAVDGPPGLCVLAARLGGFGAVPDLVVSGINPGCNTGRAVLHSGTVGAALTAANFGCKGIAVSIDVAARLLHEAAPRASTPVVDGGEATVEVVEAPEDASTGAEAGTAADRGSPRHWATAAQAAAAAVPWIVEAPRCTVLNINVPDRAAAALAGARAATLAPFGTVRSTVVESAEGGGRLQLEMRRTDSELPPGCDTALVAAGFVAVSAITGVHLDDRVDVAGAVERVVAGAGGPP
ncbi:MAG TPA: 5'/3'-nucleotidase SurE [Acidimicrobiales bacterium]